MSDYGPPPPPQDPQYPQYPGGPYPGQPPGETYPPPAPPAPFRGLAARFGERLHRRPEPRFTVAIAAAGAALALFGVLLWGGDYFSGASSPDTSRNLLGAGLGALATVAGYILMITRRGGPLATAGAVAGGIGLPLTMAFLTLDATSGDPINFDAIFWVSVVVWLASYAFVPGARGRTFFVFLIANGLVTYVLIKNASDIGVDFVFSPTGGGPRYHGLGTIAAIGLVFGLGYYLIAFLLDRAGDHGPATGLVYPAFSATSIGINAWGPTIHQAGAGVVTLVLGALVCWYGGHFGRRLTCFAAAAAVILGVILIVADASPDNTSAAGVAFILIGAVVVAAAAILATGIGERDDMDPEAIARTR
jgi:subtilisin family serine protease